MSNLISVKFFREVQTLQSNARLPFSKRMFCAFVLKTLLRSVVPNCQISHYKIREKCDVP
jgi:hypothetical protein